MADCCGLAGWPAGYAGYFRSAFGEQFALYGCLFTCSYAHLRNMLEILSPSFFECADPFLYGSLGFEDDIGTGRCACRDGHIARFQTTVIGICRYFREFLLAITHLRLPVFCKSREK